MTLGPVKVMGAGAVPIVFVVEVCLCILIIKFSGC